jgi:hypothetical protein
MPRLDDNDLQRMWAVPPSECPACFRQLRRNYCRECDEFFEEGHGPDCPWKTEHESEDHRRYPTTPTPLCGFCQTVLTEGVCPLCHPNEGKNGS